MRLSTTTVSLTLLAPAVVDVCQLVADEAGITLRCVAERPGWIVANREQLIRAAGNLVDD